MILNHPSTKSVTVLAVFFVLLMFAILLVERGDNSKISSFFDAFWYTIVTITTIGYGDITPATTAGRIIAVIIMLGGVVSFGAISGKIASVLVERQQKRNRGFAQLKKKRNHLVLCGWKPEMETIISGILASNPLMAPSDIVLVTGAPETVLLPGQYCFRSCPTNSFRESST